MQDKQILIRIPAILNDADAQHLAEEAFIVRLYGQGKIGSGYAAKQLGISRRAFLALAEQEYHLPIMDEHIDSAQEAANAERFIRDH